MTRTMHLLIRQVRARVRLVVALVFGTSLFLLLPTDWPHLLTTRLLLCWNATVVLYLLMVLWVVATADLPTLQRRASL